MRSNSSFALPSSSNLASWCGRLRARAVMPCTKSNTLSGGWPSSLKTALMTFAVSDLLNPRLRRKELAVLILAGDDLFARRLHAGNERCGGRIGETCQRRCGLMGKTLRGKFAMPDADLLKILDAPKVAIHAHRAEIKGRDTQRLRTNLAVPAIETAEIEIGIAIRQAARLDRMGVVDQEQEHVAVAGIEYPSGSGRLLEFEGLGKAPGLVT